VEAEKPMAIHLDGEPFDTTPLECTVIPKALAVLVPKHTRPELFAD
jgi:diacylglycerol kinase family enzyme